MSNLFTGSIICSECRGTLRLGSSVSKSGGKEYKYKYLFCSNARVELDCNVRSTWRYEIFEDVFLTYVSEFLDLDALSPEGDDSRLQRMREELKRTEALTAETQKQIENWLDTIGLTKSESARKRLLARIEKNEETIESLKIRASELTSEVGRLSKDATSNKTKLNSDN